MSPSSKALRKTRSFEPSRPIASDPAVALIENFRN
jgi:hypothetical protein